MDRPLTLRAHDVRAILDGRKTQHRTLLGGLYETYGDGSPPIPAYSIGQKLWVREAWRVRSLADEIKSGILPRNESVQYVAEDARQIPWDSRTRQANHMPRWASRITLLVTDVRVQRVQDISEDDAIAEGLILEHPTEDDFAWAKAYFEEFGGDMEMRPVWIAPGTDCGFGPKPRCPIWGPTAKSAFMSLWHATHGPDAWGNNDWVVARTFEVLKSNIDEVKHGQE